MEFCPSSGRILADSTTPDPSISKAFKVYNFIVGKGGDITLSELLKHPSPLKDFNETQAVEWLKIFSDPPHGDHQLEKPCFILKQVSPQEKSSIRVWLRVKLCSTYETKSACNHGADCLQWHVCRGYLDGNCKNKLCRLSHDLLDEQNIKKAQKYMLEKHPSNSVRKVLAKNLPFVCERYLKNDCKAIKNCRDLHLCPFYVRGACGKGEQDCPYSHDVNFANNKAIFKGFGIPTKYVLAHVLLPKLTSEEEKVAEKKTGPKRKGKVDNFNNLNTESEFSNTVHQNIPLNIEDSSLHKRHEKREEVSGIEGNPKKQEKSKQKSKKSGMKKHDVESQKSPQPLMAQAIPRPFPGNLVVGNTYPSLPPHHLPHSIMKVNGQEIHLGSQKRQQEKKFVKPKGMPQHMQSFGSKNDLVIDDDDDRIGNSDQHLVSGAKPKRKPKKDYRKPSDNENTLEEAELMQEEVNPTDLTSISSDQDNHPMKGRKRQRRRHRQRQGSQDESVNSGQESEENPSVDLIEFGDDDLPDDEEKLIDLDYEFSDPGLSQMSDSQSQAMWDLFAKDLLCDLNDHSLSQPNEPMQDTPLSQDGGSVFPDQIKNASVKGIFKCIIMKYGGTASYSDICNHTDLWDPCFTEQEQWFREHTSSFLLVEDSKGNIEEVKAISLRAKMCYKYNGKSSTCTQEKCPFFHICKEYITNGRCSNFHGSCKKNHGFKDSHNKTIALRLFPGNDFTNRQLRQLIFSSTPQVCMDYNNLRCQRGKHCPKVHVCKNLGYKKCPKGQCKLAHENGLKSPKTKALLERFGIRLPPKLNLYMLAKTLLVADDENIPAVSKASDTMPKETSKQPAEAIARKSDSTQYHIKSPDINSPICLAFLVGKCSQGSKCHDHHCPLPYQWVYMSGGQQWRMLDQKKNKELEKLFCEDNINDMPVVISMTLDLSTMPEFCHMDNVSYIYNVDLKTMHIGSLDLDGSVNLPLKRLSTESDILAPDCSLATTWHWYWKDENGLYVEYQPSHGCNEPSSTSIERFYQQGMSRYDFSIGQHKYRLYFNDMYQKNLDVQYLTKRDVLRRPKFVSPERLNQMKRTCKLPNVADNNQIPKHWKKMTDCQPFLLKRLNPKAKEFKTIQLLLTNSMGDREVTVNSIDRIQNPFMWEKYKRKKEHMEKHSASKQVDERQLFHGTSYKNIRSICKENFDWRLYGEVTGNKYGEGAYFARDASFSHCYCHDDEDGIRYVFIAKVLVGSFTKGAKNYRRPPPKNPDDQHSERFDSCVDSVDKPQVFVVFDVDQYYPEYVIEYRCKPADYVNTSYAGYGIPPLSATYSPPIGQHAAMTTSTPPNFASYYPNPSSIDQGVATSTTTSSNIASYPSYPSYNYPANSSGIDQGVPMPTPGTSYVTSSIAERRINEEIEKFEKSSKKADACTVM